MMESVIWRVSQTVKDSMTTSGVQSRSGESERGMCHMVFNPRRACARVTVVVLSVCLSVYPSVPALAASASFETSKQRYSRGSLRLFLD